MSDWSQATPDSIKRGKAPWVILELLFPGVTRSSFPLGKRTWVEGNLCQGQLSRTSSLVSVKTEGKKA